MTIVEQYDSVAKQARSATDRSVDILKQGAQALSDRAATLTGLPPVDLASGIDQYFELVRRTLDANHAVVLTWLEAMNSLSGAVRDQLVPEPVVPEHVVPRDVVPEHVVAEHVETVAAEAADESAKATDESAKKVADFAAKQAARAESVARAQAEKAQAARASAKQAHEKAREPYQNLTKAALSELLAKRSLPKSGNLNQLIERLVEADAK